MVEPAMQRTGPRWVEQRKNRLSQIRGWAHGRGPAHGRIVARPCTGLLPMIEPLLCGIVLGLIPVTLVGLFVAAWNQYRRGGALG